MLELGHAQVGHGDEVADIAQSAGDRLGRAYPNDHCEWAGHPRGMKETIAVREAA